ncbi:MAG: NAD(+) diphosphatase [Parvularculaceae bacterium]|nr:NAD(+) diphosphatase [Parvularculaceae bacterium]
MKPGAEVFPECCLFSHEPLDRASDHRADPQWIAARLAETSTLIAPLWRGDPLVRGERVAFLGANALGAFPADTKIIFLGLSGTAAHFAIDVSSAPSADAAPFADLGAYTPLREAAALLPPDELAIVGEARWLIDWHRRHPHCAMCGAPTEMKDGGAKRQCAACSTEHFPRSDPVAIVLATHEDACLLGRGPHFPPGFLSALAGFVEACETPEACAIRELREEAGVVIDNVRYQFSQPWPFPSSLMMGFIADAKDRALTLDSKEIEEARWVERDVVRKLIDGEKREDLRLPPRFTIARRLIERWAGG